MTDPVRDELASLARMVAAHVEWHRDLGAAGLVARTVQRVDAVVAGPAAPPVQIARPGFMPPRATPVTPPAAMPVQPAPALFGTDVLAPVVPPPGPLATADEPTRRRALEVLCGDVAECTRCGLHATRTKTVFSRGNPAAKLMFIGEGPGRDEDLQGAPFVGAAGQLLDRIIAAMGLSEADVYIANVVKCRPPNNRVPLPDEMNACGGYLTSQIEGVRPDVLVALGKTAAAYLLGDPAPMSRLRGAWHDWRGTPLRVTWHPAYLLRQPEAKKDTWDDMKRVLEQLGRPVPGPRRAGSE